MRNYSVCYLDAQGRTQGSEFLPFEDNRAAIDFARIGIVSNAIVEVWRDNDLVERLYRDKAPIVLPEPGLAPGRRFAPARPLPAPTAGKASRRGTMRAAAPSPNRRPASDDIAR